MGQAYGRVVFFGSFPEAVLLSLGPPSHHANESSEANLQEVFPGTEELFPSIYPTLSCNPVITQENS